MMETITFYGYKGGTGKSLSVAQLALCLSYSGKNVCIIDFDLEAPGVVQKFESLGYADVRSYEKGIVDYINENIHKFYKTKGKKDNTIKLEPITDAVSYISTPHKGFIHFFPAGDVLNQDNKYFKTMSKGDVHEFLVSSEQHGKFFRRMKENIANELRPKPDYLLIDSRSGINELSGICTRLLADKVVFITGNNPEGLDGTNLILSAFKNIDAQGGKVLKKKDIFLVLSRVPRYYINNQGKLVLLTDEEFSQIIYDAQKRINHGIDFADQYGPIYPLASEPMIEIKEQLPLSFETKEKALNSQLSLDYIKFFSNLVPDIEHTLKSIQIEIKTLRPYLLDATLGTITNPEDNIPNVAFRLETFNNIVTSLSENISRRMVLNGKSKIEAQKAADEDLFDAGNVAADNFSNYLKEIWNDKSNKLILDYRTKLNKWNEFDSSVGFGKFGNKIIGSGMEGQIILTNNFLLYSRTSKDINLCAFMRGYIQKVLTAIFNTEQIVVEHNLKKHCGQYKQTIPRKCIFTYKVITKKK